MIPTKPLDDLSLAALRLYRRGTKAHGHSLKIETDDASTLAAANEIAEAGYGRLHVTEKYGSTLNLNALAKGFSVARRDDATDYPGYLYVEIEVLRNAGDREGYLLACLYGAKFASRTSQGSPWPTWTAEVRHATARDTDHSGCIIATAEVDHPVIENIDGISTTLIGRLADIKMWPTDTDITLLDSHDSSPMDQPEICEYGNCGRDPHPFAPYLPERREDLDAHRGRVVRVTTTPLGLVSPNGLHVAHAPVTHADY